MNELALPNEGLRELALFAGAGGGILGGHLLGWRTVCAVEIEDYPRRVLLARQRDGILPRFPIWDDITTFDGNPWRGRVDVVSGGFPCQDISAAGKGAGLGGERSGLWSEMARVIGEVQPRNVFVENSPMLTSRGLGVVLGDLASMGYDARWGVLGSYDTDLPTRRDRIWIATRPSSVGLESNGEDRDPSKGLGGQDLRPPKTTVNVLRKFLRGEDAAGVRGMPHDVPHRVDRLKAVGNGQNPYLMALAWTVLHRGWQ